jgi:HEAT repeat protein
LLELGELSPGPLVNKYAQAATGAWRAVSARAATLPKFAEFRRERFADPDERVRRAAVDAELESPRRDNLEALLEAARLDPDPPIRSRATQAVGMLGGQRAVFALKDQWARADETTRTSIVRAWAEPASFATGGRQELLDAAEQPSGLGSVVAAEELSRLSGLEGGRGRALLAHFIAHGTDEQKSLAMVVAPLGDPDVLAELRGTAGERDRSIAVIALARLTEVGSERTTALGRLRQLGSGSDHVALVARVALAAAGDRSVVLRLRAGLFSGRARERKLAAVSLYWLGDTASAAVALADDDPGVRTQVACSILTPRISRR